MSHICICACKTPWHDTQLTELCMWWWQMGGEQMMNCENWTSCWTSCFDFSSLQKKTQLCASVECDFYGINIMTNYILLLVCVLYIYIYIYDIQLIISEAHAVALRASPERQTTTPAFPSLAPCRMLFFSTTIISLNRPHVSRDGSGGKLKSQLTSLTLLLQTSVLCQLLTYSFTSDTHTWEKDGAHLDHEKPLMLWWIWLLHFPDVTKTLPSLFL